MAIREDTIGTVISIDDIREFIPDNHPCYLIEEIVDRIDFSQWEEAHYDTPGNPSYHPRVILRPIIQGYVDGLDSGRAVARHINTDLAYMYLCGLDKPDFRTINRFYKEFADVITKTLLEVVKFAKEKGLVKLGSLGLDSTSIEANASSFNVADEKQIQAILETIKEIIRKNEEEDELLGRDNDGNSIEIKEDSEEFEKIYKEVVEYAKKQLPDDKLKFPARKQLKNAIKNPEKTLLKMQDRLEHLNNSTQNTINLTDPECVWRPNKKNNMTMGYNIHHIVDMDSGIIVSTGVSTNPDDHKDFIPQFEHYEEFYGQIPTTTALVADNGYYSEDNLATINEKGWDAYIPNKELATLFKKNKTELKPFSKYNFIFSNDFSYCTCPNNQKLTKHNTITTTKGTKTFYYADSYKTCKNCPYYKECCKSSSQKIITHYGGDLAKNMYLKMQSTRGKEIYSKRMPSVEPTFAQMKHNQGITQLRAYGVKQAQTESELIAIAQNIIRINEYIHQNNNT